MLNYNHVVAGLNEAISLYNQKSIGKDAAFYSCLSNTLQQALDNIVAKGQDSTQQDLIVGWDALRNSRQQVAMENCYENKYLIVGGTFLLGFIASNIYHKLIKRK